MKLKNVFSKVAVFGVALVCCFVLAGCGSSEYKYTGGVAATVNGTEISEDTITKYVTDFRKSSNITSDEAWANWLKESSQTPEEVREQVIDYYVTQQLTKQAADENEISVDSGSVDEQLNAMKKNYDSDKAWQDALAASGITEEQYRETIETGLLTQQLQAKVCGDTNTGTDAELLAFMNDYKDMFNGSKRSSHILFDAADKEKAEEIAKQITSGSLDFAAAVKEYSKDTGSARNNGDVGWNTTNNYAEEYSAALDTLTKGQITVATSQYGVHVILCTDVLNISGTPKSLTAYPDEIVTYMRSIYASQKQSENFDVWLDEYKEKSEVVINDMPSNVPYNIDLSQYQSEEGSDEGAEGEADESADSDNAEETVDISSEDVEVVDEGDGEEVEGEVIELDAEEGTDEENGDQ